MRTLFKPPFLSIFLSKTHVKMVFFDQKKGQNELFFDTFEAFFNSFEALNVTFDTPIVIIFETETFLFSPPQETLDPLPQNWLTCEAPLKNQVLCFWQEVSDAQERVIKTLYDKNPPHITITHGGIETVLEAHQNHPETKAATVFSAQTAETDFYLGTHAGSVRFCYGQRKGQDEKNTERWKKLLNTQLIQQIGAPLKAPLTPKDCRLDFKSPALKGQDQLLNRAHQRQNVVYGLGALTLGALSGYLLGLALGF